MAKVSVIIPARHELYLQQTIDELLKKSTGDVEVIVVLDGYWPDPPLKEDPRLIVIHRERRGMRASINSAIAIAKGKYIMKIDAHCILSPAYDEILQNDCDKDWVVIPRRYSVDMDTWEVRRHRPFIDYEYLSWPYRKQQRRSGAALNGMVWDARIDNRINVLIDETLTFQGSCWFISKEYFERRIVGLSDEGYGTFVGEAQELGLKAWLSGGKTIINKKCWYAHLWKGAPYRAKFLETYGTSYSRVGLQERKAGDRFTIEYWMKNRWEQRTHDLEWLIERFWPVPSWPEDRSKWMP